MNLHGWDSHLEGKRSMKEFFGSKKETGSLRLVVIQLTQTIAKECLSHQDMVASLCTIQLVVGGKCSRKRGRGVWTGQHKGGAHSSVPSASRLEMNFVVVLISANEQKARLEIQLLDGWVSVLEQNRLGLMQNSSDLRGSEFLFSLLKPLWALHNSFLSDFHGLSSAQTLCVTLAKSL